MSSTQTYSYNAANRLAFLADGSNINVFSYDGDGNRVSQTVAGLGTYNYVNDLAASFVVVLQESGPDGGIAMQGARRSFPHRDRASIIFTITTARSL